MNFDTTNITKINFKNNEFELNGLDLNEVITHLDINPNEVKFETDGDTLFIMPAVSGGKGITDEELENKLLSALGLKPKTTKLVLIDGKLQVVNAGKEVTSEPVVTTENEQVTTDTEVSTTVDTTSDYFVLATLLDVDTSIAEAVVNELKTLMGQDTATTTEYSVLSALLDVDTSIAEAIVGELKTLL